MQFLHLRYHDASGAPIIGLTLNFITESIWAHSHGDQWEPFLKLDKLSPLRTAAVSVIYKCVFPLAWENVHVARKQQGHYRRDGSGGKPTVPICFLVVSEPYSPHNCSFPSSWLDTPAYCIYAWSLDTFISMQEVPFHMHLCSLKGKPFQRISIRANASVNEMRVRKKIPGPQPPFINLRLKLKRRGIIWFYHSKFSLFVPLILYW